MQNVDQLHLKDDSFFFQLCIVIIIISIFNVRHIEILSRINIHCLTQ